MTRKIIRISMAVMAAFSLLACAPNDDAAQCRIHGQVTLPYHEGKRIFLVPMFGPQDAAHVDSVVIKDQKFEFVTDTAMMAVIRIDYHFRDRAQDLLVVTEPGDVNVTIGPVSTGSGTPQNDSLQVWKELTEDLNVKYRPLYADLQQSRRTRDSVWLKRTQVRIDSLRQSYRSRSRAIGDNMGDCLLGKFLRSRFPR